MKVIWDRLIRFISIDGRVLYGEPILPTNAIDLGQLTDETELSATVVAKDDIFSETETEGSRKEIVRVAKLLGPLAASDVPILRCVGLNYAKHGMSLFDNSLVQFPLTAPCDSSGSWKESATVSLHILQAQYMYCGS